AGARVTDRLAGRRAALLDPRLPSAVQHARLCAVEPERPGDAGGEDAVVVVQGDDGHAVADAELAGPGRERGGRGDLVRNGARRVDEVVLPVDVDRPGDVARLELGALGVRQRGAGVAAAHVEHADVAVEVAGQPFGADEGAGRDLEPWRGGAHVTS